MNETDLKKKNEQLQCKIATLEDLLKEYEETAIKQNIRLAEQKQEKSEALNVISGLINKVTIEGNTEVRFYNDNLSKCREIKKCLNTQCPSYRSDNPRCWQTAGTHCGGKTQGTFAQKINDCRNCEVYKAATGNLILELGEEFNIMMNVLEQKTIELHKTQAQLLQSSKMSAVGQLAGGVAHEINNPMTVILGFSQSIIKKIREEDPLYLPLKSIEREAIRCKKLIADLLTFSRTGKTQAEMADLNLTIEETVSIVEAQTKVKNIEIIKKYEENLPQLTINKNQIQQVVINLCSNAIDAMPEGGTIILATKSSSHLTATREEAEKFIEISVSDTGKGMAEEVTRHVFEPFFTTKETGKGTGLGLSICYEIVKKHNGEITVESEPGRGTKFSIKLPLLTTGN